MSGTVGPVAVAAASLLLIAAAFQLYWAAGGRRALAGVWGGGYAELPGKLRIGSALSALLFVAGAVVVLSRAGFWRLEVSYGVVYGGTWALFAILLLSSLANFASRSRWERFLNAPLAVAGSLLCLVVAPE